MPAASGLNLQAKLAIGAGNDPLELEADRVADQVLARSRPTGVGAAPLRVQRFTPRATEQTPDAAPASVERVLDQPGAPLQPALRLDMEQHFGHDFSHVRVHADAAADDSAREVSARAYTVGHDIVFGANRYAPGTSEGRRLLAHELTHVLQQGAQRPHQLQRCPDAATDAAYDTKGGAIKTHAEYAKLPPLPTKAQPGAKSTANKVIADAKPRNDCTVWIDKLKTLFDTKVKAPAVIGAETKAETAKAVVAEKARIAQPQANAKEKLEESVAAGGTFVPKPGKFGGGNYFVDSRDPNNIIVKTKILLTKKGGGTDNDVKSIKSMKDAIEKHASTVGYIVSIEFVDVADKDTFKVDVDTDKWEVATNWSGGDPKGFAHELHHMLAFPLDRYDYTSHATNQSMEVSNRLYWFSQELTKPAGYNNPTSIMNSAENANDDDACTVAGLPVANCIGSRQKVTAELARLDKEFKTADYKLRSTILKLQKTEADTMMGALRELLRRLFGLPEAAAISKRLKDNTDGLGKVFQTLSVAQQTELLKIVGP